VGVASLVESEIAALSARGLEFFADAALIVFDDRRGGVQNSLPRAVVLFDAEYLGAGKILRKTQNDAGIGAAPAIDGLVFVAHDA
jgi:hypothetical protein